MAILGVIADDFTGATDIAGMLVKGGMRTIQTIGVPAKGTIPDDVDAVVVALKTRSIAAADAIAQSLDALKALQAAGCVRFFFKYCSTFDSTDAGNIGPVGDALLDALKIERAVLAGYDWGGRAACVVAALWPERVRGLVSGDGYNIQDIAKSLEPRPPETEH
eukprot:gene17815-24224_t